MTDLAVIGNPENRRVSLFQAALARLGRPAARVISYVELLGRGARDALAELAPGTVVRVESPGENFAVTRLLLLRGARAWAEYAPGAPDLSAGHIDTLAYERGRIVSPRQVFYGFCSAMTELDRALAERPALRVMNAPAAIVAMFDKAETRRRVGTAGVTMADALGDGAIAGFDELRARMDAHAADRVFVKLRYGSSASGVVAVRTTGAGMEAVCSTIASRRSGELRLYNSLKLRCYHRLRDIRAVIDALAGHGVVVERWIDKARLGDDRLDVRIVVIAGRARHAVVRLSRSPITNLHLGGRRGRPADVVALAGEPMWRRIERIAERAAGCFADAHYAGVDAMLARDLAGVYVAEVNAFGDLLPGVDSDGHDTYTAEIASLPATGGALV